MRVAVRCFVGRHRIFEEVIEAETPDLEEIAMRHALKVAPYPRHMIEVEFLDEPDPRERFFRFGTDPRGMRMPMEIKLEDIRVQMEGTPEKNRIKENET